VLSYETTTKEGYRIYRSNPDVCRHCPFLKQCTESKDCTKRISRHIWAHYLEEADHLRHTDENRKIYGQRKETIERVIADLKEKHGMRWTTLRGVRKVTMQAMLTFAAMNLKKMAIWLWRKDRPANCNRWFSLNFIISMKQTPAALERMREFVISLARSGGSGQD